MKARPVVFLLLFGAAVLASAQQLPGRDLPMAKGYKADKHEIKIGLVSCISGDYKPWGIEALHGAQMAIDEINSSGGVLGRKVELVVEDDDSRPEGSMAAAQKLTAKDHVVAMIGQVASGLTLPMAQVCYDAGVPLLVNGATRMDVTEQGATTFRICYQDSDQAQAMALFAYKHLHMRNLAIVHDQKLPYSTGLADVFNESFTKLGGKVVAETHYDSGDTTFARQIAKVRAAQADGIYVPGYYTEVGPFVRQLRKSGSKIVVLGCDGWDSNDIFKLSAGMISGSYMTNHFAVHDPNAKQRRFNKRFRRRFHSDPKTFAAAMTYDAIMLMASAARHAKTLDSVGITNALTHSKNFHGVTGTVSINPKTGNAVRKVPILRMTSRSSKLVEMVSP